MLTFPFTRGLAALLLFPCLFLCSARLSRPAPLYLPDNPMQFACRYEEKLSGNSHIVSANRHLFCLESSRSFSSGDSLAFKARFSEILIRNRSGLFDYNRYLRQKGICARVEVLDSIRISGHTNTPYYYLSQVREGLLRKTDRISEDTLSSALIKALCLGYKENLSPAIRNLFAETGTIHLLAVSGLHTGAVWLLLTYLFKPLGLSRRKARLFLLPVLWAYACITGLSPSVVRAAYILTFITLSQAYDRDYSALNAIAASALFALIVNPAALYSVSMQMSYAAYTGIIGITPLLKKIIPLSSRLSVPICVTLAAQIATFPLSAYYFHSVSLNSFMVNLIAIPLTTLLLYAGIFALLLPEYIGTLLFYPIQFLCKVLTCSLNLFNGINLQAHNLYPTEIQLLLLYGLIFFICLYLLKRRKQLLFPIMLLLALSGGYSRLREYFLRQKKEVIIFHSYSQSCILFKQEEYGFLLKNTHPNLPKDQLAPYVRKHKLQLIPVPHGLLHAQSLYNGKQLYLRQDTLHIIDTPDTTLSGGIWIITRNIFPRQLPLQSPHPPKLVILDASNRRNCIRQWKNICHTLHIPLRTTWEEGDIHLSPNIQKRENKMPK